MWKFPDDDTRPVLTPRAHIESPHRSSVCPELPETALLFFMQSGVEHLLKNYDCRMISEKFPRFLQASPIYSLNESICFLHGGAGAPQAVDTLETLSALGVKNVFSCGMCGGFSEKVKPGDVIIPDKAFVEEGASLHYYSSIEFAQPDEILFEKFRSIPDSLVLPIVSTDAVYRQTYYKEALWREKGVVGVDMETSALMSVGKYLNIKVAAALMVSDVHPIESGAPAWRWKMTPEMRRAMFEKVLKAVV